MTGAWLSSRLARAKRIPSLFRLLRFREKPVALSPEEAASEKERHEALIQSLAPDAITDPEKIAEYVRSQEEAH